MRLGRGRGGRGDPADTTVTSELGWVRVDFDTRLWLPCPRVFPDGCDLDSWATAMSTAWWEHSGLRYQDDVIGKLATMLRVTTGQLGTGLRVLRQQTRDKGRLMALLSYAFRVEEHETDLQVFTSSSDLRALTLASDDIERLVRGIAVYRNTDERRVAEL